MSKTAPIPVRFDPPEESTLQSVKDQSGLSKSEIIRRSVRLLAMEIEKREGDLGFIVSELGPNSQPPRGGAFLAAGDRKVGLVSEKGPEFGKQKAG